MSNPELLKMDAERQCASRSEREPSATIRLWWADDPVKAWVRADYEGEPDENAALEQEWKAGQKTWDVEDEREPCEGCGQPSTRYDVDDVPLCSACYENARE